MIHKLKIVEEEADESAYWLELLKEAKIIDGSSIEKLHSEAVELTKIASASIKTLRSKS